MECGEKKYFLDKVERTWTVLFLPSHAAQLRSFGLLEKNVGFSFLWIKVLFHGLKFRTLDHFLSRDYKHEHEV
jgi:hypothetical protein